MIVRDMVVRDGKCYDREAYQKGREDALNERNCKECYSKCLDCDKRIKAYNDGRADAIEEYKNKLIDRLIPCLEQISFAKDSETYLAITEIAEGLKGEQNG